MTVNINELVKELGFCVVPTKEKPFRLDEVRFNLLAYLEDYSKMGFSFVKVATDLVKPLGSFSVLALWKGNLMV